MIMVIFDFLMNYIEALSYFGIILFILLGSIGLPLPEETILLIAGYLASVGYLKLPYVLAIVLITTFIGDNMAYWIGRIKGKSLLLKYGKYIFIHKERLEKAEKYFKNHGGKTVFFSRFIIGLRFFGPIIAGSLKMRWRRFLLFNILGILIWVPTVTLIGYFFGIHLDTIIRNVNNAKHLIFFIVVFFISAILFYKLEFDNINGKK